MWEVRIEERNARSKEKVGITYVALSGITTEWEGENIYKGYNL